MRALKTAVTIWTSILYAAVIYATLLITGIAGGSGLTPAGPSHGMIILILTAPAAIGLTIALHHWDPKEH